MNSILQDKDFIRKFNLSFERRNNDECWIWLKGTSRGKANFYFKDKFYSARRIVYKLFIDKNLKRKQLILVKCNNKLCINPNHLMTKNNIELVRLRFKKYYEETDENKCWEWFAHKNSYGYGFFRAWGKKITANRVAWILEHGEIPEGLCVLHKCDNRICVNPDHLFLGTHNDNAQDKVRKNRQAKGSKNGRSKLNEEKVREIRNLFKTNKEVTQNFLAKKYGIEQTTICKIINRKTWKHVK